MRGLIYFKILSFQKHQDLVLQNNTLREEILTLTSQAKLDKKTENTSQVGE